MYFQSLLNDLIFLLVLGGLISFDEDLRIKKYLSLKIVG